MAAAGGGASYKMVATAYSADPCAVLATAAQEVLLKTCTAISSG